MYVCMYACMHGLIFKMIGILTSAGSLGGPASSVGNAGMLDVEEKFQRDLAYSGSNYETGCHNPWCYYCLPCQFLILLSVSGLPSGEKKVMLVVVVGGLSYLEIAAFRFLSRDPAFPFRIVMGATKFVSGSSFISSMHHVA